MADITVRRTGELVRGVFQILLQHPEGLPAKEVITRLRELVPPTPFEASEYPGSPGVVRYDKIIRFYTINCVKAGWLVKDGAWTLTEAGIDAFTRLKDPEEFSRAAGAAYREWRRRSNDVAQTDEVVEVEPPPEVTLEEAEDSAFDQLRAHVEQIPPYEFQDLVAALLQAMGYHVSWVAPPGKDGGMDIVATEDPLGIHGPRIKVQVKHRNETADVGDLRAFSAVLGPHDVGIFVSRNGFTRDAEAETRAQESRRLTLLDLRALLHLWSRYYDRIEPAKRSLLPLRPVYFLAPA